MKKSNEQTIREVIQEMLEAYKLREGLQVSNILQAWDSIAGPYIARYTEKLYIKDHKLFIKLTSPALKHELSYSKTELIQRLNDHARDDVITEIVLL